MTLLSINEFLKLLFGTCFYYVIMTGVIIISVTVTLGRPRCRWVDSIKMDFKRDRMGWYGLDLSGSG
jgi:hypothetical protein